ncbi:hypothetical protein DFH08DRAFT_1086023 [Mycena albidolilacea]|uniref:Uncharacterized protein n=1 Tax=Mycena albidolilacea TaxID=1033008 RepID=A0AAD7EG78_9AGAR|nr:hypothetical protein DFH08DRAFT_1086023 [Mycena albidolilacea]
MADTTANNSKHTPAEQLFINALPARRLMDFRNYMYSPLYITSNAAGFLCHEWIDLPALKGFLASSATAADSNASTRPDVYSPAYILSNAQQFLDLTWVDTRSLRSFLAQNMKAISNSKCKAVDSHGIKCEGAPIMKLKPQGSSRGHEYFIACSGFTPSFNHGHQTHSIPDNVDEQLLAKSLADQPLSDDTTKDTPPCTKLGDPHTGHKLQFCAHAHISNGKVVRGRITQYTCSSARSRQFEKSSPRNHGGLE